MEAEGLGCNSLGPTWLCVWCVGVWCAQGEISWWWVSLGSPLSLRNVWTYGAVILGELCCKCLDILVTSRLGANVFLVLFPDGCPRAVPVKKSDNATAQVGRSQGLEFSLTRNRFPRYPART